jgi:hypothetical protein
MCFDVLDMALTTIPALDAATSGWQRWMNSAHLTLLVLLQIGQSKLGENV